MQHPQAESTPPCFNSYSPASTSYAAAPPTPNYATPSPGVASSCSTSYRVPTATERITNPFDDLPLHQATPTDPMAYPTAGPCNDWPPRLKVWFMWILRSGIQVTPIDTNVTPTCCYLLWGHAYLLLISKVKLHSFQHSIAPYHGEVVETAPPPNRYIGPPPPVQQQQPIMSIPPYEMTSSLHNTNLYLSQQTAAPPPPSYVQPHHQRFTSPYPSGSTVQQNYRNYGKYMNIYCNLQK